MTQTSEIEAAVVQHALDCGTTYLRNSHLNRGIPETPARLQVFPGTPQVPPPTPQTPATAPQTPAPASRPVGWLIPALGVAGSGLLGSGATALVLWLAGMIGGSAPDIPAIPQEPPAERPGDPGSVLQWLEDNGFNVPPEQRVKK